jgi:hypothetical protein
VQLQHDWNHQVETVLAAQRCRVRLAVNNHFIAAPHARRIMPSTEPAHGPRRKSLWSGRDGVQVRSGQAALSLTSAQEAKA